MWRDFTVIQLAYCWESRLAEIIKSFYIISPNKSRTVVPDSLSLMLPMEWVESADVLEIVAVLASRNLGVLRRGWGAMHRHDCCADRIAGTIERSLVQVS